MARVPFSAVISVYKNDDPVNFELALQSITRDQTEKPNEVVLIVDGPIPDDLSSVVDRFDAEDSTIRVVRLPENKGLGMAMRLAVELCSNELIARMDSDDYSEPTRFAQQLHAFEEHPELDVVGGDIAEFIGDISNTVGRRVVPTDDAAIKHYMKTRCGMNHVTVMFKKSAVLRAGNYKDWFWNEDYYLWIRMQENNSTFGNTGTVLVKVRSGEDMYQRRGGKKYFQSEKKLQNYMLEHKMINRGTYCMNVLKRWLVQIVLPNKLRGWVFRTFAREN